MTNPQPPSDRHVIEKVSSGPSPDDGATDSDPTSPVSNVRSIVDHPISKSLAYILKQLGQDPRIKVRLLALLFAFNAFSMIVCLALYFGASRDSPLRRLIAYFIIGLVLGSVVIFMVTFIKIDETLSADQLDSGYRIVYNHKTPNKDTESE